MSPNILARQDRHIRAGLSTTGAVAGCQKDSKCSYCCSVIIFVYFIIINNSIGGAADCAWGWFKSRRVGVWLERWFAAYSILHLNRSYRTRYTDWGWFWLWGGGRNRKRTATSEDTQYANFYDGYCGVSLLVLHLHCGIVSPRSESAFPVCTSSTAKIKESQPNEHHPKCYIEQDMTLWVVEQAFGREGNGQYFAVIKLLCAWKKEGGFLSYFLQFNTLSDFPGD